MQIPIFMYHRVVDEATEYVFSSHTQVGITIPRGIFKAQIEHIQHNYNVVSLAALVQHLGKGTPLPRNPCVLTFDDGFADNYWNAFPILKHAGLCATFFLIGDCIAGSEKVRWLDEYYFLLDATLLKECTLEIPGHLPLTYYKLHAPDTEDRKKLTALVRGFPHSQKSWLLRQLAAALEVSVDAAKLNNSLYLSEPQILEMASSHMTFGAHTMTHPAALGHMDLEQSQREIINSGQIIKTLTGEEQPPFAYPFGGSDSYNQQIIQVLHEHNFLCACTALPGTNNSVTPLFELKRVNVTASTEL